MEQTHKKTRTRRIIYLRNEGISDVFTESHYLTLSPSKYF
jgi:hypothetical protein